MPDDRIHSLEPAPPDWGAAFAALPQEMPDADAWPRIARARRRRRPHWPVWLATAAVLALAAVVPWKLSTDAASQPEAATPVAARDAIAVSVPANADATADDTRQRPVSTRTGAAVADAGDARWSAQQQGDAARAATADATPRPPAAEDDAASELERLYTESARLEALVVMARDDRVVTTGAAAALTSRYDAQVAAIDARLMQPDIAAIERVRLWRERVEAMRGLASFETSQRLLAARGERYDAMLVSIE